MAKIKPNSTEIILLKNVPLDSSYEHTIIFDSVSQQEAQFKKYSPRVYDDYTYAGRNENIRVKGNAEELMKYNYIMFRNSAYTNKWFYAFVLDLIYIAKDVTEIEFEIDVLQSFMFDYELGQCFVEREHSKSDGIGDNIIDEPVSLGDYVTNYWNRTTEDFGKDLIGERVNVLASTALPKTVGDIAFDEDRDGYIEVGGSGEYNHCAAVATNLAGGVLYRAYNNNDDGISRMMIDIKNLTKGEKEKGIISVFTMPKAFAAELKKGWTVNNVEINYYPLKHYDVVAKRNNNNLDGYKPKNNKLFTYPFNFLQISNNMGSTVNLRYEFFAKDTQYLHFEIYGNMSCAPEIACYPKNYAGKYLNYENSIMISGFPQLAYTTDAYTAWLASAPRKFVSSLASGAVGGVVAGGVAGAAAGAVSAIGSVTSLLSEGYSASKQPQANHGNNNGSLNASLDLIDFHFTNKSITYQYAKIIDDYFTRFGYATKRNKIPNTRARKAFTFTKVIKTCFKSSNVPNTYLRKIAEIYENGITFWEYPSQIGDYSVDNSPK